MKAEMATVTYHNPWIPAGALDALRHESGTILDVGGGAAPYYRASHVFDIQPFDADRLRRNAWALDPRSGERGYGERCWTRDEYSEWDLCAGEQWPFDDKSFDLGLCSHTLEDLRDPIQVVRELGRVCKRTLIITPSRLFEQMRGVDHPRYCGMPHHLWLVEAEQGELRFRRKTPMVELPGSHLRCPFGRRLTVEAGSLWYLADQPRAREVMYFEAGEDRAEFARFVTRHQDLTGQLVRDPRFRDWRQWVWYAKQVLGKG